MRSIFRPAKRVNTSPNERPSFLAISSIFFASSMGSRRTSVGVPRGILYRPSRRQSRDSVPGTVTVSLKRSTEKSFGYSVELPRALKLLHLRKEKNANFGHHGLYHATKKGRSPPKGCRGAGYSTGANLHGFSRENLRFSRSS